MEQAAANRVIPIVPENVLAGVEAFVTGGVLCVTMLLRGLKPQDKEHMFAFASVVVFFTIAFLLSVFLKARRRFHHRGVYAGADVMSAVGFTAVVTVCVMISASHRPHGLLNNLALGFASAACAATAISPFVR